MILSIVPPVDGISLYPLSRKGIAHVTHDAGHRVYVDDISIAGDILDTFTPERKVSKAELAAKAKKKEGPKMKILSTVRLDAGIKADLVLLSKMFRTSQTNILQLAIREFWIAHIKEVVPLQERDEL